MAYSVKLTDSFVRDYDSAIAYLSNGLNNLQAAASLASAIADASALLSAMPELHAVSIRKNLGERGVRTHLVKGYAILYVFDGNDVVFLRLPHQSQCFDGDEYWRQ